MQYVSMREDTSLDRMQATVDAWRNEHSMQPLPVKLDKDTVCYSTLEAIDWLGAHANDMCCPAVKYYDETMRPAGPEARELEVERQLESLRVKLEARNRPWWKEHQTGTDGMVECAHCRSMLNVAYCGVRKGWRNHCPVCHADLHPRAVQDQFDRWKQEYLQLREERDRLRDKRRHPLNWLILTSPQGRPSHIKITCR